MSAITTEQHALLAYTMDNMRTLHSALSGEIQRMEKVLGMLEEPGYATMDWPGLVIAHGTEYNSGYAAVKALFDLIPPTLIP